MWPLLHFLGLLPLAGGLSVAATTPGAGVPTPAALASGRTAATTPPVPFALARAAQLRAGLTDITDPVTVELDPTYRFLCVWHERSGPGLATLPMPRVTLQAWEAVMKDMGQPGMSTLGSVRYDDPCVLGFTKLTWACFLTGISMIIVIVCIPVLLLISRRRPPGAPIFPDCCCDSCCQAKRPPPSRALQFVY
mmetsp:Transcript_74393/g.210503  ORF Transcript_74393/g.210503 Transcript_74393/m.210503 type:complete len:193 (-) Transcript_74393:82-660(-)